MIAGKEIKADTNLILTQCRNGEKYGKKNILVNDAYFGFNNKLW